MHNIPTFSEVIKKGSNNRTPSFSFFPFLSMGLKDGISPYALITVAFFLFFLFSVKYTRKEMTAVGILFIFAVFTVSLLAGTGHFKVFRSVELSYLLFKVTYYVISASAIVLGVLSIYDWWIYKKTHDPERFIFKVPLISGSSRHTIMTPRADRQPKRNKLFWLKILILAVVSGVFISLLESTRSEKVFLPTAIYFLTAQGFKMRAYSYAVIYNIAFVFPLLAVFLGAVNALSSESFIRFANRHLPKIKAATAAAFLGFGIGLLFVLNNRQF